MGKITYLECDGCGERLPGAAGPRVCACVGLLLARYDVPAIRESWRKESFRDSVSSLWRYAPLLPAEPDEAVTLGEGWTPAVYADTLSRLIGVEQVWVKDEGRNPTGSAHARAMSAAVTMAKKTGLKDLAINSNGDSGAALAAYCAAAKITAEIYLPDDCSPGGIAECRAYGASVKLGRSAVAVNSLLQSYGFEGWKTLGFEIAEQFGWQPPDCIFFPCGETAPLIAIWKAFAELEELGWLEGKRPRIIAVQSEGCQPIVAALGGAESGYETGSRAFTLATELRVPQPAGLDRAATILRESGGTAIAVSDKDMMTSAQALWETEGICASLGGGACLAGARKLAGAGVISPGDRLLLCNVASGLKNLTFFSTRFPRLNGSEQDKLGGLITPR